MKKEVRFKPHLFFGHVRCMKCLGIARAVTKKSGPQEGRSMRNWGQESALCGHGRAFAEKQLVLGAGKGRSGLVAQVVHAAEELAIHHERKVSAHG